MGSVVVYRHSGICYSGGNKFGGRKMTTLVRKIARKHYHVLHGMLGGYMPNVNEIAWTKQQAWDMAQWELRHDREQGMVTSKVASQEWVIGNEYVSRGGVPMYVCSISEVCYLIDCYEHGEFTGSFETDTIAADSLTAVTSNDSESN